MNIIDIFLKSNVIIQIVMLILFILSIVSWGIIIYQIYIFRDINQSTIRFEDKFLSGISFKKLYQDSIHRRPLLQGIEQAFYLGFQKFSQLYHVNHYPLQETLKEIEQVMYISMQTELKELEIYIFTLGIIGSTSPYFGLFGTIISIIHIFFKLGSVKYISLQTIAPGISEALIFTAGGLFVAIPSILAFHYLNLCVDHFEKKYKIFLKEFLSVLQNQIFLKKI